MTGGDADFVYNNLMPGSANNNQVVNNQGSNIQGYSMNAANLNLQRKSMNNKGASLGGGGTVSNTSKQRLGGSFMQQPGGQYSSF